MAAASQRASLSPLLPGNRMITIPVWAIKWGLSPRLRGHFGRHTTLSHRAVVCPRCGGVRLGRQAAVALWRSSISFQSSPDPWVGCNWCLDGKAITPGPCFNPHPTPGSDAISGFRPRELQAASMFQSSPDPWVGCNRPARSGSGCDFTCFNPHPTPGSDAIPRTSWPTGCTSGFNPHPTPGSDAIRPAHSRSSCICLFRSSPDPWVGCNCIRGYLRRCGNEVSILTRPLGRMQYRLFGLVAECFPVSILTRPLGRMQSPRPCCRSGATTRFNPHPTPGSDAMAMPGGIPLAE